MKIKRHKKVHKFVNFYINNFGFRAPFQILIDGTFCFAALKNKIDIQDQLPKYLKSELKLLTTPCVILETEKLGPKVHGAMLIVKKFAVHKCTHDKTPVSGSDCLKSMVGKKNSNRYMIATQDRELQDHLRTIPGVPIMYLHQTTPCLEQPSDVSMNYAKTNIDQRFSISEREKTVITKLKEEVGLVESDEKPRKKKKKKKGANPLSCLKSKKKKSTIQNGKVEKKENVEKPNRKKIRIPKHVKEELMKAASNQS